MDPANESASSTVPWDDLIRAAVAARAQAYAPYSGFHVGAAILTSRGTIHAGANIENASYGLTLCAERVAMAQAFMAGESTVTAFAVASDAGIAPCGACRQFLVEFTADAPVALIDTSNANAIQMTTLAELLPHQFTRRSWKR